MINIPKESGDLHAHTEYSLRDANKTIKDYIRAAQEKNLYAIAITDHGTCMGWQTFYSACKEVGIKGILGVEAYVQGSYGNREHLTLLAANRDGYRRISRIVSESNENLEDDFPIVTYENLMKNLNGCRGSVIALSGCVQGVLASELLRNEETEKKIEKLKRKAERFKNPSDPVYLRLKEELSEAERLFEDASKEQKEAKALADKKYKQRRRALKVLLETDPDLYDEKMAALDREEAESQEAKETLPTLKKTVDSLRKNVSAKREAVKKCEKGIEKWQEIEQEINGLEQQKLPVQELYRTAVRKASWFQQLMGLGGFFIELQYHGLDLEKQVMPVLAEISVRTGIPVVATNDSHMATIDETDKLSFVRSLRFSRWHASSESDRQLYVKDNDELAKGLASCGIPDRVIEHALKNIKWIADQCTCDYFDGRNYYPKYRDDNGQIVEASPALLRKMAYDRIQVRFHHKEFTQQYRERLEYELATIIELGYADYLLIVQDFINYAKKLAPYAVGPGRGSGAGSLVCYLLGITNIDPIPLNLLFERFLNRERVSMPDIDTDFSDEIREQVIAYVTHKYGQDCVAYISTVMTQGAKQAVRNAARVFGWEEFPVEDGTYAELRAADLENGTKKSTTYKYDRKEKQKQIARIGDDMCKDLPDKPGTKLADYMDQLKQKYHDDTSLKILSLAERVEGTVIGNGIHAAGVIISDGTPLKDIVPLVYMPQKQVMAVQCDMVQAESIGLLKMDFLGLVNLYIISDTIRAVRERTGRDVRPDDLVPNDPEVYQHIFAAGETDAVFQVESQGMKDMLKRFKPESFEDLVLLVAAYRPGPMQYLDGIIRTKNTGQHDITCLTKIREIRDIISVTYDAVVYQEQVMQIFQRLAGYTLGQSDIVRRAMSKKKLDKLEQERQAFLYGDESRGIVGCAANGINVTLANTLFDQMIDFAKYAFNKSHAAAYAFVSYQTAWLKYYYPVEYMCSVLKHTKAKKLPSMLGACRMMGIKVLQPDINLSEENFCIDLEGNIRYGLSSIKGVAKAADAILEERRNHGSFRSFKDFLLRAHSKHDVTVSLIKAGAFLALEPTANRSGLLDVEEQCVSLAKKIQSNQEKIAALTAVAPITQKERIDAERGIASAQSALAKAKEDLERIVLYELPEDGVAVLREEKELLGVYCSAHPLDFYDKAMSGAGMTPVRNATKECHFYAGIISNLRIVRRKSDGRPFAFFDLEDRTGIISCSCFTKSYEVNAKFVEDGTAVKIRGTIERKEQMNEDGEMETEMSLVVEYVAPLPKNRDAVMLSFKNSADYSQAFDDIRHAVSADGFRLMIHLESSGQLISAPDTFLIKKDVAVSEITGCQSVIRFKGGDI